MDIVHWRLRDYEWKKRDKLCVWVCAISKLMKVPSFWIKTGTIDEKKWRKWRNETNEWNDKICREDLHEFPITSNGYIKLQLRLASPFSITLHSARYKTVHAADFTKYCDDGFDTCFFYLIGYSLCMLHSVLCLSFHRFLSICSSACTTAHWLPNKQEKLSLEIRSRGLRQQW